MSNALGRTVVLRNDPTSQENIKIGIESEVWGSRFAGVNAEVKSGEPCIFLIGVSVANLQELKEDETFRKALKGFPNVKNDNLSDLLLENIQFNAEEVFYGVTTSDWYVDESEIWPPREFEKKRKNSDEKEVFYDFYKNRFKWRYTHKVTNLLITKDTFNSSFIRSIILSLRDKCVAPFKVKDTTQIESFKSTMELKAPLNEEEFQNLSQEANERPIPDGPLKRVEQSKGVNTKKWPRSPTIASTALKAAKHLCEIDEKHISFTSQTTQNNYTEAHHLIPMEFQGQFQYSLDVPENIISLCSNCHNMIHYAVKEEKTPLIHKLFQERAKALESRSIEVKFEQLKKYYGL